MYDWPEVASAHDALWTAIANRLNAAGTAAPEALDRSRPSDEVWADPGLVLSQTCGYSYATRLRRKVRLVATPAYDVEGCSGPRYSSAVIARRGEGGALADHAGRRVAFNARDSLSGYVALLTAMREEGLDPGGFEWVEAGSHRGSVRAVASGAADLAAIDAICWALALEHEPDTASGLQVVAWTLQRPGLPLITAGWRSEDDLSRIRTALEYGLADAGTTRARRALHISGFAVLNDEDYEPFGALGV